MNVIYLEKFALLFVGIFGIVAAFVVVGLAWKKEQPMPDVRSPLSTTS